MRSAPPSILRRLLAWLLTPGPARDGLVGDLDELYVQRLRAGRATATLWYLRQVASTVIHYSPRRLLAWWRRPDGTGKTEELRTSLGSALRALKRRPGFAAVVVLTLALGIGANTAVFSVVRSVVLQPLPFPEADRLAVLLLRMERAGYPEGHPSIPEYVTYRDQLRSWEQLAAYRIFEATVTGSGGYAERVYVAVTTRNLFAALGAEAVHGRTFTSDEDQPGSDAVALLSYGYWQSRYGADPGVVGKDVVLEGRTRTIVGVMPAGFGFPDTDVRFWVPLAISSQHLAARGVHQYSVVGRLQPGVTLASAETELAAVTQRVTADPAFNFHDWHPAFLRPLRAQIVGDVSQALWMIFAAVGLVLVIACANVANLLLVRSEDRAREMAVRSALGAGRGRLLLQLLTESLVMTSAGGLAGVILAWIGVDVLHAMAPPGLPRLEEISVDGIVLALTVFITLSAALLFGVLPALQVGRTDVQRRLREEGGSTTAGRARTRLRHTLVVSETALAVVLLISAGLLLQSYRRVSSVDPGYSTEQVLTATLDLPDERYAEWEDPVAFYESLLARVRGLPGVTAAGAVRHAPLSGPVGPSSVEVEGWVELPDASPPVAVIQVATPGYFEAMGIPVLEGRALDAGDRDGSTPVAVVTESFARSYWPGKSVLGGRLRLDDPDLPFAKIVGVVPDMRQNRLDRPPEHGTMFLPHAQAPGRSMTLAVRSSVEPTSLVSAIQTEVAALDPSIPVYEVRTMEEALADTTASERFTALLQLLFALVALSLSAVGLYGVLAFTVARRTNEIGIRIALGAGRRRVRRMVMRQGMGLVALAIAVGLVGALAVGRSLERLLYRTSALDPLTYCVVVATLLLVAILASWIPARRASSADPIRALRAE